MNVSMPTYSRRAIKKAQQERSRATTAQWLDGTIALAVERGLTLGDIAKSVGMDTYELVADFEAGLSWETTFGIVEALDMRLSEWVTQVVGD